MKSSRMDLLIDQLRDGRLKVLQFVDTVTSATIDTEAVVTAMRQALNQQDWVTLQALVLVAARKPSSIYVPELSKVLAAGSPEMTNEDVADCLRRTLQHLAASDVDLGKTPLSLGPILKIDVQSVNIKSVQALAAIQTSETRTALQRIAESNPFSEVRKAARAALR